jgi:pantetheine-phosphate adenylyltransferase
MPTAVYPGSFDPITLGHVDIIRRIQPILGEITVLISQHPTKPGLFSAEERKRLCEAALKNVPGVTVDVHQGLTVDYMREVGARVIVRGLRAVTDFEYELVMANMNKKLAPGIETMIVFASPEFYYVASSTVKEVALHGGSVEGLVPPVVEKALKSKFAAASKASPKAAPKRRSK